MGQSDVRLGPRKDPQLGGDSQREARCAERSESGEPVVDVVDDERDEANGHQDDDQPGSLYDGHATVIGTRASALKPSRRA